MGRPQSLKSLRPEKFPKGNCLRPNIKPEAASIEAFIRPNKPTRSKAELRTIQVNYIADQLVEKFSAPSYRPFFLKVGWHLNESTIWDVAERALAPRVKSPIGFFITVCKAEMNLQK